MSQEAGFGWESSDLNNKKVQFDLDMKQHSQTLIRSELLCFVTFRLRLLHIS